MSEYVGTFFKVRPWSFGSSRVIDGGLMGELGEDCIGVIFPIEEGKEEHFSSMAS